jgi:hypothetical protein
MRVSSIFICIVIFLMIVLVSAGCTNASGTRAAPTATTGQFAVPSAHYPDITGTWKSADEAGWNLNTSIQDVTVGENTWVFASQDGPVVKGFKLFRQPDGPDVNQTVLGIFDPEGKTLTIIDQPGGWAKGTLTGPDTMFVVLTYSSGKDTGGNSFALAMTLHRVKG